MHLTRILIFSVILGLTATAAPVVPGLLHVDDAATRGRVLIEELNCRACHEGTVGKTAPRLERVGNRLDAESLRTLLDKPGNTMPKQALSEQERDELIAFLSGRQGQQLAEPAGDADVGARLFHEVGCVACHAPEPGRIPAGLALAEALPAPETPSVPIDHARRYPVAELAAFLRTPHALRPAGRMPSLKLSEKEAVDIAAYLSIGKSPRKAEARPQPAIYRQRCASCHDTPEDAAGPLRGAACSSVDYRLSDRQVADIAAALKAPAARSLSETLAIFNCTACHERDGVGGPEDPGRNPFFSFAYASAAALGEEGRIPPPLTGVGRKLTSDWLHKILVEGEGEIRDTMATRMPHYGGDNVGHLVAEFARADPPTPGIRMDISGHQRHHRAPYGRTEFGTDGVSCVTCHGVLGHKSLGVPGPDLTQTAARLRPNWFMEFMRNPAALRPGTRMPALLTSKTDQRIEQLWTYLKEDEQMHLPKGLIRGGYELKPSERAIVFRTFMEVAGTEAVAVGFPAGVHAAFDSHRVGWALVWRGRFLDAESTWIIRRTPPAPPLGQDVKALEIPRRNARFLGYELDTEGIPTFLYQEGEVMVEDRFEPDGEGFRRTLRRDGVETTEVITW